MKKKITSMITAIAVMATMGIMTAAPAMAKAPAKEEVKYEGEGKVEVEFVGDVQWNNHKVTVKDTSGKKYGVEIVKRDDDEIEFIVKKYKNGKKYNFWIKGVREFENGEYGTVKGSFKIPKKSKTISRAKAKSIAINNAVKVYNIKRNTVRDYDIEKDTYHGKAVWEVSFDAKKRSGAWCEYEYKINRSSGKILYKEQDYDD